MKDWLGAANAGIVALCAFVLAGQRPGIADILTYFGMFAMMWQAVFVALALFSKEK
jgi:hypothetical protein